MIFSRSLIPLLIISSFSLSHENRLIDAQMTQVTGSRFTHEKGQKPVCEILRVIKIVKKFGGLDKITTMFKYFTE